MSHNSARQCQTCETCQSSQRNRTVTKLRGGSRRIAINGLAMCVWIVLYVAVANDLS